MVIEAAARSTALTTRGRDDYPEFPLEARPRPDMKLLLVRHAIALDRETPGVSDYLRPLTEEGIARFRKSAAAIGELVTAGTLLTSPLLRARQTAEILAGQWPGVAMVETEALGTGSREEFEKGLKGHGARSVVAAVGHEPYLSEWTAAWLGAREGAAFAFKKGGCALIEFEGAAQPGAGRLVFFLAPRAMRKLS